MTSLLRYDAACQALAEAKSFDEVRDWEDKAAAVREYARRAKNRSLEIDALEIRERARRRRGELLIELKSQGLLFEGQKKELSAADDSSRLTLEQLDTTRNESSRDQKLAQVPTDSFERLISRCRDYMEQHPEKHSFADIPNGPINGARSIMGSRQEPDDSLDYFPTPPWATRALMERVWPVAVPSGRIASAWEPACGEGHIAEVLEEYCNAVLASDIHDYGYGDIIDFLQSPPEPRVDWIITNPPFGDKAEQFVTRALTMTQVGVAMFFRLQWLETVGRYERIFQPYPPSLIAQFVERVPIHKGRWEPEGDTATAYLWIVWMPARQEARGLTEFIWIPPGCREALTHSDDAKRFTAHPVIRKQHHFDSSGNPLTHNNDGEVVVPFPLEQRMEG